MQSIALSKTYRSPNGSSKQFQRSCSASAAGSKLRADEGRRTLSCLRARRRLRATLRNAVSTRPGILWYEVRVSDGALRQEGFVDDPDCDYLMPSLAVDANGNLGLGCTRTSEKEFPSVYVMMHAAKDAPGTMRAPVVAVAGTTYYRGPLSGNTNAVGWGNYSSTCVDPTDPNLLGTCQELRQLARSRENGARHGPLFDSTRARKHRNEDSRQSILSFLEAPTMPNVIQELFGMSVPHGKLSDCIHELKEGLRSVQETAYHRILTGHPSSSGRRGRIPVSIFRATTQTAPISAMYF